MGRVQRKLQWPTEVTTCRTMALGSTVHPSLSPSPQDSLPCSLRGYPFHGIGVQLYKLSRGVQ